MAAALLVQCARSCTSTKFSKVSPLSAHFLLTRLWVLRGSPGETTAISTASGRESSQPSPSGSASTSSSAPTSGSNGIPGSSPGVCACLLASRDWWFAAGIAVAIGVNFKGQMLSISPIFIIWPLVQGRFGGALRWICGMAFGMAAITSGWLITYIPTGDRLNAIHDIQASTPVMQYPPDLFAIPRVFDLPAAVWIFEMLITALMVPWLLRVLTPPQDQPAAPRWKMILRSRWTWIATAAIFIMAITYWPWLLKQNRSSWHLGILCGTALAASALFLPRRALPYLLAAVTAGGLFLCIPLFHGSAAWWDCGFHYGSIHWPYMVTGPASNIPAIFELRFGWAEPNDQIAFTLPAIAAHWPAFITSQQLWPAFSLDVTAKILFDTIYGVMLLLSGIAIGLQARRNDRRILVALVTPWLMFFLFPVQIQERYLLYGAAAAACCIGDSVGMALLGLLLTLCTRDHGNDPPSQLEHRRPRHLRPKPQQSLPPHLLPRQRPNHASIPPGLAPGHRLGRAGDRDDILYLSFLPSRRPV